MPCGCATCRGQRSKSYSRRIDGNTFIGSKIPVQRNVANALANRIRNNGNNARVIPAKNGYRVYVEQSNQNGIYARSNSEIDKEIARRARSMRNNLEAEIQRYDEIEAEIKRLEKELLKSQIQKLKKRKDEIQRMQDFQNLSRKEFKRKYGR